MVRDVIVTFRLRCANNGFDAHYQLRGDSVKASSSDWFVPADGAFMSFSRHSDAMESSALSLNDCWVVGLERFAVGPTGEEEEFFEIKAEWCEKSVTHLRRGHHDLLNLAKNLSKLFPEDRGCLSQSLMLKALQKIKEAENSNVREIRLDAVELFLRSVIKMPQKYSQSETVLTFFKSSPFDYTLKSMNEPVQHLHQSPVTASDVRRANGFCLANTETVIFDTYLGGRVKPATVYSSKPSCETVLKHSKIQNGIRHDKRTVNKLPKGSMCSAVILDKYESKDGNGHCKVSELTSSNLTYLQLDACETDILE